MTARARLRFLSTLARFGRPHRRALVIGVLGSAAWVACRLAMPWPLRGVIELVFTETGSGAGRHQAVLALLPGAGSALLWLLAAYVAIISALGLAEWTQRLHMTKFAGRTMRDLRDAAVMSVNAAGASVGHGELVVRLVSDVARAKADLKGILVHGSQNGLLFASICALFLFLSPLMALFLFGGGFVTIAIGFRAARRVADVAEGQREREGQFAAALVGGLETGEGLATVGGREIRTLGEPGLARLVTGSSLVTHIALALTVAAALAIGVAEVRGGTLGAGELFLFVAYALMVHRRLIQLGRQLVRAGKLKASVDRLAALLEQPAQGGRPTQLASVIRIEQLRVDSRRGGRPRLGPLDIDIAAGERVAVVGRSGAGKSTLLRVLARLERASAGSIRWDHRPLEEVAPESASYLAQAPQVPARRCWEILGLGGPELVPPAQLRTLEQIGAWSVVAHLPRGLRQVVSSRSLAPGEVRALCAGRMALGGGALWLLDALDEGLGGKETARRVEAILARAGGRTVIAAFARLRAAELFTRVIELKRGRIAFDGGPAAWRAWRSGEVAEGAEASCKA